MRYRSGRSLYLIISILCLLLACVARHPVVRAETSGAESITVQTRSGLVRGKLEGQVRQFLGIPYATPPAGNLRWKAPQPHAPWTGALDATKFGSPCAQVSFGGRGRASSEDCLCLNIYTPKAADSGLPVMVWIHGGTFLVGSGSGYDGRKLADKGKLVVVTINYRLGPFGFLVNRSLDAESPCHGSGNYGLLDQQAAILWVKDNIAVFGGDPNRITIAGESAGAISVGLQLVSPGASGLFQRAIMESGPFLRTRPLADAEKRGDDFAARLGCEKAPDIAGCIRSKPTEQVLGAIPASPVASDELVWSPVVDGHVIPVQPAQALASGKFNKVPVINGSNHDEGTLFMAFARPENAQEFQEGVRGRFGKGADRVLAEYPLVSYASPSLASAAGFGDVVFSCPIEMTGELLSRHVPVYEYEFNDPHAPNRFIPNPPFPMGAFHGSEIQYIFPASTTRPRHEAPLSAEQEKLSDAMMDYWIGFIRAGEPGGTSPRWKRFRPGGDRILSLSPGAIGYESDFVNQHHCELWNSIRP